MKAIYRFLSIIITFALSISSLSLSAVSVHAEALLLGDTDLSGDISITDATLIQRSIVGLLKLDSNSRLAGDIDGDGSLTIYDVTCIQRWLVSLGVDHSIGEPLSPTPAQAEISADGKTASVGNVSFNISKLPDTVSITDSNKEKGITLMIVPNSDVDPRDMTTVVNNGNYKYTIDYTDPHFKESYLIEKDNGILQGYDCSVIDDNGNELAFVYAHYKSGLYYPYQTAIYCFKQAKGSFPIDYYYKGVLIKRVTVNVNVSSGKSDAESIDRFVRSVEGKCWNNSMSDSEKLKAFGNYIADHYSYDQVVCVSGAVYTAIAARDLGLNSMLLYPGGEATQPCDRHIVTYNLYAGTAVPGGHCACLVEYEDGYIRYDVQGGLCWIRDYQFPY